MVIRTLTTQFEEIAFGLASLFMVLLFLLMMGWIPASIMAFGCISTFFKGRYEGW